MPSMSHTRGSGNGLRRFGPTRRERRVPGCLRRPDFQQKPWPWPRRVPLRCVGSENDRGLQDCTWQEYGATGFTIQYCSATGGLTSTQTVPSPSRKTWNGEASTKPSWLLALVEAARFSGGQFSALSRTKWTETSSFHSDASKLESRVVNRMGKSICPARDFGA
jgi:hypothetical protein